MFRVKIKKVGNSLGIFIPSPEVQYNEYKEAEWVEVRMIRVSQEEGLESTHDTLESKPKAGLKDKEEGKNELGSNTSKN